MSPRLFRIITFVLFICLLSACMEAPSPSAEPTDTSTPTETPSPTAEPTGTSAPIESPTVTAQPAQPTPPTWPLKDMTVRPQIWFGPLDPWSWDQHFPGAGPFQFYDLFADDAPWEQTAAAVHVIRLYPIWLESYGSQAELQVVFENLKKRRIAISYESGPLTERGSCNAATIEGFSGAPVARNIANNIQAAGGVLYSMDLEHGFDAATYYDGACRMSPTEIAQDVSRTINAVRALFPDVIVGSIETADLDVNDVADWLTAYKEVMGEELGYFHLDISYYRPDWAERAKEIETYVQSRGIDFGIIYFGDEQDTSDEQWLARVEQRFIEYEVMTGGRPDHAIFQSWHPHPQRLLPETESGTFTHLVSHYLRPRSALTLDISNQVAGGFLTTVNGDPISNAPIEISITPVSGDGVFLDYTITGLVPQDATTADVGLRINTECDCSNQTELTLAGANYNEQEQLTNKVPNGEFWNGFEGWSIWGTGDQELVSGENGAGNSLHIKASAYQSVGLNSDSILVTPRMEFTITFRARINPQSEGSGYFDIIFLNESGEIGRLTLPLQAARVVAGSTQTGTDGRFILSIGDLPQGTLEARAWFAGDEAVWPAIAEQLINP